MPDTAHPRSIRSFVTRAGRITAAQQRALETLWPQYGLDYREEPLALTALFGREAPCTLEIGFGNGANLVALARAHPQRHYLGVEVHRPGVGRLLLALEQEALTNVRVVCHDAVEVLDRQIAPGSLAEVLILFPDPWPKKRHHKRRLIQPAFMIELNRVLITGGRVQIVTDHQEYFEQIEPVLASSPLRVLEYNRPGSAADGEFVGTNFERKYRREGRPFYAIAAIKPVSEVK